MRVRIVKSGKRWMVWSATFNGREVWVNTPNTFDYPGVEETIQWLWGYFERNGFKGDEMKYASAFYVTAPNVEILIFIDEPAKDVPEHSLMIVETKDTTELLNAVESFFILGAGS